MNRRANGAGAIKRLIGRLAFAKGRALAVIATLALVAVAGVGCAPLGGASSTRLVAHTTPTVTTYDSTTLTLEPTQATTATPASHSTPTSGPGPRPTTPIQRPTPRPTVAPKPRLDVSATYVQEPSGCGAQYPDYFANGLTVKNSGGGTLTWTISLPPTLPLSASRIQFTALSGSLKAGKSQFVRMYWVYGGPGIGGIPPSGGVPFTISSNGGEYQLWLECAPS